jgi:probable HAF family extracellular repeat protein
MRLRVLVYALSLASFGFNSFSFAAQQKTGVLLTPDGTGRYSAVEIGSGFVPTALNAQGHVVGYTTNTSYYQPFFWTKPDGVQFLEPYVTDPSAIAYGINDSDQIVGESFPLPYNLGRAILWSSPTEIKNLGTLGGDGASANAVNNKGVVVGTSRLSGSDKLQPFIWSEISGINWLGSLGGEGHCRDISNSGHAVGVSYAQDGHSHAFFWTDSTGMLDIGKLLPSETRSSSATAVNDLDKVVGVCQTNDRPTKAFTWTAAGGIEYLNSLVGEAGTYGINNSGIIVGYSDALAVGENWKIHAVVWRDSVVTDLNQLLSTKLDYKLTTAVGINDFGQIIAISDRYYIPEPSTLFLICMGTMILCCKRTTD